MSRRCKHHPGMLVAPRGPTPPTYARVAAALAAVGALHPDIARLEVFGSVVAGHAGPGSDVDVLVSFGPGQRPRGLAYFGRLEELREEITAALGTDGVAVDLHERAVAEVCENPIRRASVLAGARTVYGRP